MPLRCILVPTGPGIDPRHRLDAALRICRSTHAHIDMFYIEPDPESVLRSTPDVILASGVTAESIARDRREAAEKARHFTVEREWRADTGVSEDPGREGITDGLIDEFLAGRTVAIPDVNLDPRFDAEARALYAYLCNRFGG